MVDESCECGKQRKQIECSQSGSFKCATVCQVVHDCGVHSCEVQCCTIDHSADNKCLLDPSTNKKCKCGKEDNLSTTRIKCTDPFESCQSPCKKSMLCGHQCTLSCHDRACLCDKESVVKCKCEETKLKVKCTELED